MSQITDGAEAKYPNPDTVPMPTLERVFWRRKLPRSMLFYLKCISRELMLAETNNYNQHAADFFEELLKQRTEELKMLPPVSYLDKLIKKLGLERPESPEPQPSPLLSPVRCTRCGRWLNPNALAPSDAATSASNVTTHLEGDEECKVIALTSTGRDSFGRLVYRHVARDTEGGDEPFNIRSLSFLVDY